MSNPHQSEKVDEQSPMQQYLLSKVVENEVEIIVRQTQLERLKNTRNELNGRVVALKEELKDALKDPKLVAEVVRFISPTKVLIALDEDERYVVNVDPGVDIDALVPGSRVAVVDNFYTIVKILPNTNDPMVSMMKVDKVPNSTYEMIGGLDNQIKQIKEVIELPVKHPELFLSVGIDPPKGVLLYGPPGTGKTMLARAVAYHTDCTFIRVSGSELVQKYIGEGARMMRELFTMARKHSPSIIFMDEVDSIGSKRGNDAATGDSEVERTMMELLNQLDGFEPTKDIKVIMATNRIDILDPALLRPGRIDRKIEFPAPNTESRLEILKIHSRKMNLGRGIDLAGVAERMGGANGAELKGVCTEAGMMALREGRTHVTLDDFDLAVGRIIVKQESSGNQSIRMMTK